MALIEVEDLWYGYRPGHDVLRAIYLQIEAGEYLALIGQNGAGKTTLAKHFNGLYKPTRGAVRVAGIDTRSAGVAQFATRVGYCYQNPDHQIFQGTIEEEVAFGPRNLGLGQAEVEERVAEALGAVGLLAKRKQEPWFVGKGERQRIAVASVLAMRPEAIVLDEPTTGLDWRGAREMLALVDRLNREGHTIIVITHDMRLVAEHARRVVALCQGQVLIDATPAEAFAQTERLRQTFLMPPQVTQLSQALGQRTALTVDELARRLEVIP
ncbi:MAG: energy-coupling factor ABC transporter ATP-binding protein [Bacillota bacterium]